MHKTTIRAGSNIAFIKYWGVLDASINLPLNSSISMTLAEAVTTTTLEWVEDGLERDEITLDGERLAQQAAARIVDQLDLVRALGGVEWRARVMSHNNFPMASGIASSASGFAALTVAATQALGLDLDATALSALARRGSGSASRSLFDGFVEWTQGHDHATSVAHQLFPASHWDLVDVVAVVSSAAKHVSSAGGHTLAATSPLNVGRVEAANTGLETVRRAIASRDLELLGPTIEQDALAMHGVMMTGTPSLLYWRPATLEVLQAVRQWREYDRLPVYFTIDAGPNVHLICERPTVQSLQERLSALSSVKRTIVSGPGPAPYQLDTHLF